MAIKDFFRSSQIIASSSLDSMDRDIESAEYIIPYVEDQERLHPHIDFGDPANFAKYGSAQEYYDQSLKYIYGEYPYDGSLKEKFEWRNNSTLLDLYIFDNRYPKSTGYAIFSPDGWGTLQGSIVKGYGAPASSDYEYVNFQGGPTSPYGASLGTASLSNVFDSKANIWDTDVTGSGTRESNLKLDLDAGVTVEFWLKTGSTNGAIFPATLTEKQVVFDLWNNQTASSTDYGRFRIEIDAKAGVSRAAAPFRVTLLSGSDPTSGPRGLSTSSLDIGSSLDLNSFSDWAHYAFTLINSGSNITTRLYVNGDLSETITTGSNIGEIANPLQANIGALLTGTFDPTTLANVAPDLGSGKLSGSLDEFRFWKAKRDSEQIGRFWFTSNLGGGTNTDFANTTLGVYYKFNEGITTDTSVDNTVLDYSGRITNGTWTGYSSTSRNTGSAIVSASVGVEDLDPIVRPQHSNITNLSTELALSGTVWDYENNSSFYYTMPSWIIDEDEGNGEKGDLKKLTQIMGTYFDNLQMQIGELSNFNAAYYPSSSAQGELFKPYVYASRAVKSHGLEAPELFSNIDLFEYYRNRNEDKEYDQDIQTIKSFIYNNIYNNLANIYKAKGTEKAFRNLTNCFGIDENLIRFNAYADNQTYKLETKRRATSYKTKAVDFNHIDRFTSTVHQYADTSNANSVSYISGSATDSKTLEDGFSTTLEAEIVFPLKQSVLSGKKWTQEVSYTTASLFGMHTAIASSSMVGTETDLTWNSPDAANFQVYAIRDKVESNDAYFKLTASAGGMILGDVDLDNGITSSYFNNIYNNSKWNFAVRVKPHGYPQSFSSGALDGANDYSVEFYGVNYIADRKINEFEVTKPVSKALAEAFLTSSKRAYVGAHHTNFTGSTLQYSDVKVTSLRYWFDYLDNTTIQNHAIDPSSFGPTNPSRDSFLLEPDLISVQVPQIDTLALYWDFDTVTGSDAAGHFTVQDVSSGSATETGSYGWLGGIVKYQHTGRGFSFPASSTASVENQYLYAARTQLPEVVHGDDNIRVLSQEETEIFTRETRPTKTYYAFEKSMYQVISDEILNYFASIADFNNLIGDPVNRYRQEYKGLKYLRQFFFERVRNEPDLDKFIDYYKWLDSTLETMLMQLVPASAQVSDGIDNVVESHILERNKYWSKFPTLEFNVPTPETGALGINYLLYNWRTGHRPLSGLQSASCFYWKERAERDTDPLNKTNIGTAPADATSDRRMIFSASYQVLERSYTTPYKYSVEKNKAIHGGINYSENKKMHFYRGINFPHGPIDSTWIPQNVLVVFNYDIDKFEACLDDNREHGSIPQDQPHSHHGEQPIQKKKYSFGTHIGRVTTPSGTFDGVKGEIAMPFNIISASHTGGITVYGYNKEIQNRFLSSSQLVNLHNDGYGDLNEVPMQGPFTEQYVGGHQARHVRLNSPSNPSKAKITITGAGSNSQVITITSADGRSVGYTAAASENTSADPPEFKNTDSVAMAASLKNCIESKNGHDGRISVTLTGDDKVLILTQIAQGTDGNTAITENVSNLVATDFAGGVDGGQQTPLIGGDGNPAANNLDGQYTRPEAYRLLLGGGPPWPWCSPIGDGAIGITGPDYGGPYPDQARYRAWFFREETAKRPVNIRNILQTTSSVDLVLSGTLQHGPIGNYEKVYQVVQTSGRSTNNSWFNDNGATLPAKYTTNQPKTTNLHTLVAVRPATDWLSTSMRSRGNGFLAGGSSSADLGSEQHRNYVRLSNLYLPQAAVNHSSSDGSITVTQLPDRTTQNTVFVERFSAPGGPEVNSLGFLDIMAAEKSVYNALPWRNLMVRGSGSGEEEVVIPDSDETNRGTVRTATIGVRDHLNKPRGLRTLLTLHAGWGGIDGTYGIISTGDYLESPSMHKVNRNALRRVSSSVGSTDYDSLHEYGTGSLYDNWFVQHPIPQNDFQYNWISASFLTSSAQAATNFNAAGHAPRSGLSPVLRGARGTVTFANVPNNDEIITIVSTDGTSKAYKKRPSENTTADPPQFHGATAKACAISLKACIEAATGHNGKITADLGGDGLLLLEQSILGGAGNRTITENLANATVTGFTGGNVGFIPAIAFLSSSQPDYSGAVHQRPTSFNDQEGIGVDFVGLNTLIYDPTGSAFNILGTSSNTFPLSPINDVSDPRIYRNTAIATLGGDAFLAAHHEGGAPVAEGWLSFNALMLHRNGPYGYPTWKQIRNQEHSLVRQMRAKNTISIIDPQTEDAVVRSAKGYMGYKWFPSKFSFLADIYGNQDRFRMTTTASVLAYHEPALNLNMPMTFEADIDTSGMSATFGSAYPLLTKLHYKASYSNQKEYFVNSKLNEHLKLESTGKTSGDILIGGFRDGQLNSQLINLRYNETIHPRRINVYRPHIRSRTTYLSNFWRSLRQNRSVYADWGDGGQPNTFAGTNLTASWINSQGIAVPTSSMWPLDARRDFAPTGSVPTDGIPLVSSYQVGTKNPKVYVASGSIGTARGSMYPLGGGAEGELQNSLTTVHTAMTPGCNTFAWGAGYDATINPNRYFISASALYNRKHTIVTGSSILPWSSAFGPRGWASTRLSPSKVVPFAGDAPWDAGTQLGREPFYDSYADYTQQMKRYGKEYSILPEYRMSDRIEDYLLNNVDPFNDTALFSLTGALSNTTSSKETDFYKVYSHTDFMRYFGVVQATSTELNAEPIELSLSCQGLLKLLPYDGFYPASRTLQLARLFSQSYGPHIMLTGTVPAMKDTPITPNARPSLWRAFLTPMFAPGLMFNTIKSGLAVDFPIFTDAAPQSCSVGGVPLDTHITHPSYVIKGNANQSFDARVPFEALVEPEQHIANTLIYDMEVHPSCSFSGNVDWPGSTPVNEARARWNGQGDNRYRLAMHNFLAETPEFFLENGTFTTFFSAPQNLWTIGNRFDHRNTSYKMRLKIRKSYHSYKYSGSWDITGVKSNETRRGDIYPQIVSGSETIVMYSRPSAFGPPVGGGPPSVYPGGTDGNIDHLNTRWNRGFHGDSRFGYYPHVTPPYYDGESWVDLEYNPGLDNPPIGIPTVEELLSRLTASYLRFAGPLTDAGTSDHWLHGLGGPKEHRGPTAVVPTVGPMSGAWECNMNSMQISASVNLFGSTKGLQDILKYEGVDLGTGEDRWVIQTKFETPILNFIDNSSSMHAATPGLTPAGVSIMTEDFADTPCSGGYYTRPIGMWHQLGRLPEGNEGVYLEIADVPTNEDLYLYPARTTTPMAGAGSITGSLASLVGLEQTSQKLGRTAPSKTIREAVVAIPFVENTVTRTMPAGPMQDITLEYNEKQFFTIEKYQVEYIWNPSTSTFPAEAAKQSVVDMINAMQRYVFPPSMDFITYPDVDPFSMYIFEFEHTLNQQDLINIWQNLPPRIAKSFEISEDVGGTQVPVVEALPTSEIVQRKTITHPLQTGELLSGVDQKLQWMVFKVKQKAQTNYFRKVVEGNSATTLPFYARQPVVTDVIAAGAGKGGVQKTDPFPLTYNWPYDFFSLVELAKIDEQVAFATLERSADGPVVVLPFGDTGPPAIGALTRGGTSYQGASMLASTANGENGQSQPQFNLPPAALISPQVGQTQTAAAAPTVRNIPTAVPGQDRQSYQTTQPSTVRTFPVVVPQQRGGDSGYQGATMLAPTANGGNGQPQYITNYGGAYSPFKPAAGQGGYYGTGGGGYSGGGGGINQ